MDKRIIISGIIISVILSGCRPVVQTNTQEHLLQSVTWYQQSAEMKALYVQSYNWAAKVLKEKVEKGSGKPIAVILDIDETVLDNSPQTALQIVDGVPYNPTRSHCSSGITWVTFQESSITGRMEPIWKM